MLENDQPASAKVALHIDRCLSCLSCMTTCPSGVDYMHLVDQARVRIEKTFRRPLADRFVRGLLARILPYRGRFRAVLVLARLGRPWRRCLQSSARPAGAWRRCCGLRPARLPSRGAARPGMRFAAGGAGARPRGAPHGLRAAGARSGDQQGRNPPSEPLRRRGRAAGRARAAAARSSTIWAAKQPRAGARAEEHRCLDARDRGRRPRRHRHHRLRLRHDDQGLRPHVPPRSGLCREGGANLGALARHHRVSRPARPSSRHAAGAGASSPIIPPARCSTASA